MFQIFHVHRGSPNMSIVFCDDLKKCDHIINFLTIILCIYNRASVFYNIKMYYYRFKHGGLFIFKGIQIRGPFMGHIFGMPNISIRCIFTDVAFARKIYAMPVETRL